MYDFFSKLSYMKKSRRIICRIPEQLDDDLQQLATLLDQPEAEIIRKALSDFIARAHPTKNESWYARAKRYHVIGPTSDKLPKDLSTNKKYFEGFGK